VPIQENALNSALAESLSALDFHATAEETRKATGAKRCDIQIRRRHGDRRCTAVECRIGRNEAQKRAAVRDARRWLNQSGCWNAVALCHPGDSARTGRKRRGSGSTWPRTC